MLREDTEFIGNAIGIDPSGCGCTDCIVGNSMPSDDYKIDELIKAHLDGGRKIVNRTSGTIIMYKTGNGEYKMDVIGSTEVHFIPQDHSAKEPTEYDIVFHSSSCACDDCSYYRSSLSLSDAISTSYALRRHFEDGETILNWTGYTLIAYKTWEGSYAFAELDLSFDNETVSIITYDY